MQHAAFERKVAVTVGFCLCRDPVSKLTQAVCAQEILKAVALLRDMYRRGTVTVLTLSGKIKTCIGNFDDSIVQIALDKLLVGSNLPACSNFVRSFLCFLPCTALTSAATGLCALQRRAVGAQADGPPWQGASCH